MGGHDPDDSELLRRTAGGDEQAFTDLYRKYSAGVFRFVLQMTGRRQVAEDVTQEAFLALMREAGGYRPERGALAPFLYGIARNHLLRRLARDGPADFGQPGERAAADDPAADLLKAELVETVRAAVLSLPAHYREAVVLCDLEEMDYRGAAETLGCAVGTVRSRLHRAHELLARRLKAGGGPELLNIRDIRCWT
jgi:RNA polymerase sigma-70 factor (ECF subfamily)